MKEALKEQANAYMNMAGNVRLSYLHNELWQQLFLLKILYHQTIMVSCVLGFQAVVKYILCILTIHIMAQSLYHSNCILILYANVSRSVSIAMSSIQ